MIENESSSPKSPLLYLLLIIPLLGVLGFISLTANQPGGFPLAGNQATSTEAPELILTETLPVTSPLAPDDVTAIPSTMSANRDLNLVATVSGQTAFALLLETTTEVKYKKYDFGVFIESIDGLAGDKENFWAFYLNGIRATTGADATVLKAGDQASFKYEKIEL